MLYDLEKLLECADPQEVAESIGLAVTRKGKNIYCQCPSHKKTIGREDNNISNCVLTPHGYCCFACGAKGNLYQMVSDYLNVSFGEAVKMVASVTGGQFEINNEKKKEVIKKQPFSAEDLALIGLTSVANPEGDAGKEILGASDTRPETNAFFRRGDEYITYVSVKRITLNKLFMEDEKLYYKLVADNAEIYLKKYIDLYNSFGNRGSQTFSSIFFLLSENGNIDSKKIAEIKNILLLNIKKVDRMLKEAKSKI